MRRILALVFLLVLLPACCAEEGEFAVAAKGAVIIEASSGRILYALNEDRMLPMASTTKIMTCLLALENCALSEIVTASGNAYGTPGTSIYLSEGEKLTMEQMLYGLMLRSGNDAAVAVAEHVAGSQSAFVEMMNDRAAQMGVDARFANPHGLDQEGHAASALAMATILSEALKNADFARISATRQKIIPWPGNEFSRVLQNKNRLLTSYEGAMGGKTGYTDGAGRCLVFSAERDGMRIVGCVLGCSAWFDTAEMLLDFGFENFALKFAVSEGAVVTTLPVSGGQRRAVEVVADRALSFPVGVGERYEVEWDIPEAAHAPVKKGDVAGRALAVVEGEVVASANLLYAADVPYNDMEAALGKVIDLWLLAH